MWFTIALLVPLVLFVIFRFIENPEDESKNKKIRYGLLGSSIGVFLIFLSVGIITSIEPDESPSFYDTNNIEDMNQEELEDYSDWLEEQRKKESDKTKIYN